MSSTKKRHAPKSHSARTATLRPRSGPKSKSAFQVIGIVGKKSDVLTPKTAQRMVKILGKSAENLIYDETISGLLGTKKSQTREYICNHADMVISLGGDGTLLRTARHLSKKSTPIFSVNTGNTGFLTEATFSNFRKKWQQILNKKYKIDMRTMIAVTLQKKDGEQHAFQALNDVVMNQGACARLIKLRILINNLDAASFRADGLIIATPTGSTGHSLSAGGPVVHPKVGGIIITPISPVLLSMRPIIIPDDRTVTVHIETDRKLLAKIGLTIDGQDTIPLDYGDAIIVRKSENVVPLIRTLDRNYYRVLNEKLQWGRER